MGTRRKSAGAMQARRTLQLILTREGEKVRRARMRRGWTQKQLGAKVGLAQATVSDLERGQGGALSLETWQQVALVLQLHLDFTLGRDPMEEPEDAGHLKIQELVLRLGRELRMIRHFELSTKPGNSQLSTDVGLIDDLNRRLIQVECVNVFGNVNNSVRSADRKRAEAEDLAVALGNGESYTVHQVWVVRATRRNRALLARYPELFATRFTGSSLAWVNALTKGTKPPGELGLVWCDVGATRLFEWRRR